MAQVRVDVISIGTLSRNLLWKETEPVRTAHATCSLIRTDKRNILIDPGLPAAALGARLYERTGLKPDAIDTVFLTNARPAHRAGLPAFRKAKVLLHEIEQMFALENLRRMLEEAEDAEDRGPIAAEIDILESFRSAEDELAPQIDLFPLFGYTPGTCGVLVSGAIQTILIAGDAVASQDHLLAGQVLPGCFNLEQAKESLREVYEIADIVVPGHDNVFPSPRGFGGR
jgi:glyoxylase-like metal-dependent hydrolase (beta-lactamase superfamily II)